MAIKDFLKRHLFLKKLADFFYQNKSKFFLRPIYCAMFKKKTITTNNSTVTEFLINGKIKKNILVSSHLEDVYKPVIFKSNNRSEVCKVMVPDIYNALLPNTYVFGGNNTCVTNLHGTFFSLNDKYDLPSSYRYDFANGACYWFNKKQSKFFIDKEPILVEEGINLFGEASLNYYHWMIDICARMAYINKFSELSKVPLLVDEIISKKKSYLDILEGINIHHHPIVYIKHNQTYLIRSLHYFSPVSFSGVFPLQRVIRNGFPNRSDSMNALLRFSKNADVCKLYKDSIYRLTNGLCNQHGERLFITRKGVYNRLINEKEIAEIAVKYGFELFDPGMHTIGEQILAFSHAKFVIGDEGAAFTNCVWCNSSTTFAIIIPSVWNNYVFSTLAYVSQTNIIYLDAKSLGKRGKRNFRDHYLDPIYFEEYLKSLEA